VLVVDDGSTGRDRPDRGGAWCYGHPAYDQQGLRRGAPDDLFCRPQDLGVEELVIIDSVGQYEPGRDPPAAYAELREGNDAVLPAADSRRAAPGPTGKGRSRRSWPAGRSTPGFSPPTPT
jgi:hypothetical protein